MLTRLVSLIVPMCVASFLAACATAPQQQAKPQTEPSVVVSPLPKSFAETNELVVKICDEYKTECYIRFVSLNNGKATGVKRRSGSSWGNIQSSVYRGGVLTVKIAQTRRGVPRVITMTLDETTGTGMVTGPLSGGRSGTFTEKLQIMKRS